MRTELIFSAIAATCIVTTAIWIMEQSTRRSEPALSTTDQRTSIGSPKRSEEPLTDNESSRITHSDGTNSRIRKCKVNGKIIYTDSDCGPNADQLEVDIHDSAGITSPLPTPPKALPVTRTAEPGNQTAAPGTYVIGAQKNNDSCERIKNEIEYLDALARQPQSIPMQEWIRRQREKLAPQQC